MGASKRAQRITRVLFAEQSIASAGIIAMATVNSIAGARLSGVPAWAGVPTAMFLAGSSAGALGWGFVMERFGRRKGLVGGLIIAAMGALIAGLAVMRPSLSIFLLGMVGIGIGQAATLLGRFAAADVNPPDLRGRAIAFVVLGGAVGSILGPLLVGPAGGLSIRVGQDELLGAYGVGFLLFSLAALIIFIMLRPEPMEIGRSMGEVSREARVDRSNRRIILDAFKIRGVRIAMATMVIGQLVMVMLMVITSLYMKEYGHDLRAISVVISAHTVGMYAFSVISGRLSDRYGRAPVILAGSAVLILAGIGSRISPDLIPLTIFLFLLGLGWNFCYVAGSAMLTDSLPRPAHSRVQGFNDLLVGAASAAGSITSGLIFAAIGYQAVGLIGALASLIPAALAFWLIRTGRGLAQEAEVQPL